MYFEIKVNGKLIGRVGDENVENIHLALSGDPGEQYVFASATIKQGELRTHYDWIQYQIDSGDSIEFVPIAPCEVPAPLKKFVMGRPQKAPSDDVTCDFCQRKETEVEHLIRIDEHRPNICSSCVELCNDILAHKL